MPHTIDRYKVNLSENKCIACHMKQDGKDKAKATEMSAPHFIDRFGEKLDKPSAGRYFCNQCHVPQVDAKPLVENDFKTVSR